MENKDHVSIEIKNLANPLIRELESLPPSSKGCCIYKVPESRRHLHPSDYTPKIVSIGPLHHGKEELKATEEHKRRYLKYFLQRTTVSVEDLLALVKENEVKLRNCYSGTIHFESGEFVRMILLDSIFLIEFFLRCHDRELRIGDDFLRIVFVHIQDDFFLVENQIPLFILNDLFNLVKNASQGGYYEGISFSNIAGCWFKVDIRNALPIAMELVKINSSKAKHFLDIFILCLQQCDSCDEIAVKDLTIPSAKELHQAGVKFKSVSSENPLEIRFNNGVLELPFIGMNKSIGILLRNLLVFESLHHETRYLNDFIGMMGSLIRGPKDAELLYENEITPRGNSDLFATSIGNLHSDTVFRLSSFQYAAIYAKLRDHCKKPRNKWKATLKQNYFNTPWASISVIAAVLLLLLTIIQTVCSIIAL